MSYGYRPPPYYTQSRPLSARAAGPLSLLRRLDWVLMLSVLALGVIGSALVWSATRSQHESVGADPYSSLKRHLLNLAIGFVLCGLLAAFDYRLLRAYAPLVYVASCAGLIAVLSPLGATINGSHSWIVLGGGFSVQPSEFAKVALVLGMAMLLAEKRVDEDTPRDIDVIYTLLLAAVPIMLVMLQPDVGTVMVFTVMVLAVILVSGAPNRWVVGLLAVGVLGIVAIVQLGVLSQYQVNRIAAFANPALDPAGAGYNANQARIAVGSGGLWGKGLGEGSQTSGNFVPEQQTDFIFTVAGEELGFVGCAVIIALFGVVLWRALRIAATTHEQYGVLIAAGVAAWLGFQVFQSVGMTVGIMPITGLPLPFLSYGGSAMFATMMAVGLLQNVHVRRSA
ncbi:MAG: rod shape-determining protein RodA [Streptomycetales bacterium]